MSCFTTRLDETNLLGLDTVLNQNKMNQRGFLASEQISNIRGSNEFDGLNLFGGQHQMDFQNSGLLQPLQQQQSGFSDIQHLQQQLMLKKMQELRRQKSMQQVDTRQHNFVNQASLFAKQPTDHCSDDLINPVRMGFVQQQDDHSLYGVPVSSSTGPLNPFPYGATDKALTRQIPTYGNSFPGNQHHTSGQGLTSWINMAQVQQVKPTYQTDSDQMFKGPQDLTSPSEISHDEPAMPSLDPEEEKFLFGSDVNIWDAFGSDRTSNLQDDNEFGSGIPSIQSGSWSALMQSAVAESTGRDTSLLEEMTGLTSQNLQHPSDRPPPNNEIDNSLLNSQSNDSTQVMHEEIAHGDGIWRVDAHSNSIVDLTPASTSMDSQQINEGFAVNTAASTPNLSNMHGDSQFGQLPSISHQLNYWKHVASTVKAQHHLNQVSESLNSSDKEDVKLHEIESRRNRESSHDSYQSTSSRQPISDAGDVRAQSGRLTSGQQKFQYHPMGNLDEDVETPYWKTQGINTTPMSLQHFGGLRGQDQESLGHIKVSSQVSTVGQNMLELIRKVDQSRDGGTRSHIISSECNLSSETLEPDHLDGSLEGPQRSQSLNSQGFGIHVLPLSQQLSVPANASTSLSWAHISSNLRDKSQPALAFWSPFQETPHAEFKNTNMGTLGSVFPSSSSQLQNHQIKSSGSRLNIAKSTFVEQDTENRSNLFPITGTSSLNSQGLASAFEQSTKGSIPPVSSPIVDHGQRMNGPLGKISVIDAFPVNPSTNQIDLEAFGRSLTTYNIGQNSSARNQMSATGNMDHDPFHRVAKRLKRSDSLSDGQVESQSFVRSNSMTVIKSEHSHISPQMAPTWFDRYGTFKTDQLHETVGEVKSVVQPFNIEKLSGGFEIHGQASPADTSQVGVISKCHVPPLVAREQPTLLPMDARIQSLVTLRPKTHMLTTVDLCPWLVEVSGSFKHLKGICTGAVEWSRAANLLMEKVDDDGDMIEDVLPISRPKKRLIVATLLMQQLLRPPPAAILSLDACSNYESMVFHGTRLALGDASNLVSSIKNYSGTCLGRANSRSDESEQSERIDDHRLSKVVEDFRSKAGKLENDFLRLDKRTSILDLRLEFQDLEKFSIINRFARFHGRGQSDMAESSSNAPASRPFPQRYVTAVPLPLNLPDSVRCLSL